MFPKRFAQKGEVPRHEQTHTGEKPYPRSMCPRQNRLENVGGRGGGGHLTARYMKQFPSPVSPDNR